MIFICYYYRELPVVFLSRETKRYLSLSPSLSSLFFRLQNRHQPRQNVCQLNAWCQTMMIPFHRILPVQNSNQSIPNLPEQANQLGLVCLLAVYLLE